MITSNYEMLTKKGYNPGLSQRNNVNSFTSALEKGLTYKDGTGNSSAEDTDFKSMFMGLKDSYEQRFRDGDIETKFQIGASEMSFKEWDKLIKNVDMAIDTKNEPSAADLLKDSDKVCPYSAYAKDGIIEHNGVVFNCDYEHNALTLGNMQDPDPSKILNIKLPSGGYFRMNVDNIADIMKCKDFFSPKDLNAILDAIKQYNYSKTKQGQIDDEITEKLLNL